jgi:glucose-6-phosphate 1-epimerase
MSDLKKLEISGHVSLVKGEGDLPKVLVETPWSSAEVYLLGAHVTQFQKKGEAPLLFMSAASKFEAGAPIRGGVPIIFPWFGPRERFPPHGYARTKDWSLTKTSASANGAVNLHFQLSDVESFDLEFIVTVAEALTMELIVRNHSDQAATIENCLHTYFQIDAIAAISITGLSGVSYFNKLTGTHTIETNAPIQISSEVDRVYQNTTSTVEIHDSALSRKICIAKSGSHSTVVWNPWIAKSKAMPDFGDAEYQHMVCVESGNVLDNPATIQPNASTTLKVVVSSENLP